MKHVQLQRRRPSTDFSSPPQLDAAAGFPGEDDVLVEHLRRLIDAASVWIEQVTASGTRIVARSPPTREGDGDEQAKQPLLSLVEDRADVIEAAANDEHRCRIMVKPRRSRDGDGLRQQLAVLRPVLDSWISLWHDRGVERLERVALRSVLDDQGLATIIVAPDSTIRWANRSALELLDVGEELRRRSDMLAARAPDDTIRLRVAIAHVLDGERRSTILRLPPAAGARRSIMLAVCPIDGDQAAAAVHVMDPNVDVKPMLEPLCRAYQLTPVECHLATLLATGSTLALTAKVMKIKEATARSYLKQIFLKTDTHRQPDLIRVLLSAVIRWPGANGAEVL